MNEQSSARTDAERVERFKQKYGAAIIDNGLRLRPGDFIDEVEWRDQLDQHYTRAWLEFTYGELYPRGIIHDRTRLLMMVGICLALNEPVQIENHLRGALLLGANAREVLEVIVQSTAYVGMPTTVQVVRVLDRVAKEEGRSSELGI